jgi:hypothetical protein
VKPTGIRTILCKLHNIDKPKIPLSIMALKVQAYLSWQLPYLDSIPVENVGRGPFFILDAISPRIEAEKLSYYRTGRFLTLYRNGVCVERPAFLRDILPALSCSKVVFLYTKGMFALKKLLNSLEPMPPSTPFQIVNPSAVPFALSASFSQPAGQTHDSAAVDVSLCPPAVRDLALSTSQVQASVMQEALPAEPALFGATMVRS